MATINTVNYKIQPNSNTVIVNDNDQYNYLHHVIVILILVIDKDTKRMGKNLTSLQYCSHKLKENSSSSTNAFHSVNYSCTEIKTKQKLHTEVQTIIRHTYFYFLLLHLKTSHSKHMNISGIKQASMCACMHAHTPVNILLKSDKPEE